MEISLHTAVKNNLIEVICDLVTEGASIEEENSDGDHPLHLAVKLGKEDIARLLIDIGANANAKNPHYLYNPLHLAAKYKSITIFKLLVDAGADLNIKDMEGNTPLHTAAESRSEEITKFLLETEAVDTSAKNFFGESAVHLAVKSNSLNVLNLLLAAGTDASTPDYFGNTPVHLAIESKNEDILTALLKVSVEVNEKNKAGDTPMHLAVTLGVVNILAKLIAAGADPNIEGRFGKNSLHLAIEFDDLNVIKLLINAGTIDINKKNGLGYTFMDLAIKSENLPLLCLLVHAGADLNKRSRNGDVPLTDFVWQMRKENDDEVKSCIKLLIEGTDVNLVNKNGLNIIVSALQKSSNFREKASIDETFLQHIAKLVSLGFQIDQTLLNYISNKGTYNEYFTKCLNELEKAKNTKLRNCWVTFFNILVDKEGKLVKYAGNEDLIQDFKVRIGEFSIYGVSMQCKIEKGISNRKLYDNASNVLSYFLPMFNPTHLIIRDTLDVLGEKDLEKLNL